MIITSFYYLQYPDCLPDDPNNASSEVYVEVGKLGDSIHHFEKTYSLTVCTAEFIRLHLIKHHFYVARSILVVEQFTDPIIKSALEAILPDIAKYAVEK